MQTRLRSFRHVLIHISGIFWVIGFSACKHTSVQSVTPNDTLVYIMAGQSNMAGRGMVEAQDTVTNPRILSLEANGSIVLKTEPNALNQGGLAGLDCGKSFGEHLLWKLPESTYICLVQCSISSTPIQYWLGDSLVVVHLYSNMLERSRLAMRSGKLKGVLWFHGEGDADELETARAYGTQVQKLILKFRNDIGDPQLPFFVGQLASWCLKPYADTVNRSIETMAQGLNDVYVIPTEGLTGKSDSLHFDAAGQRALGRLYAEMAGKHL